MKKCTENVYPNDRMGAFHPYRCTRKATHDDETKCKQHSTQSKDARDKKRREESDARYEINMVKWRWGVSGPEALKVIHQIANGHNDPRSLAKDFLETHSKDLPR